MSDSHPFLQIMSYIPKSGGTEAITETAKRIFDTGYIYEVLELLIHNSESFPWVSLCNPGEEERILADASFAAACEMLDDEIDAVAPKHESSSQCLNYVNVLLQAKNPDGGMEQLFDIAGKAIAKNGYLDEDAAGFSLKKSFLESFLSAQFIKSQDIPGFEEYLRICMDKSGSLLALDGMIYFPGLTERDIESVRMGGVSMQLLDDVRDIIPDAQDGSSNSVCILLSNGYRQEEAVDYVLRTAIRLSNAAKNTPDITPVVSKCLSNVHNYICSHAKQHYGDIGFCLPDRQSKRPITQ